MPGPGSYLMGDEERKEVMDVLESGYLYRYGDLQNPRFKRKVFTLEREFAAFSGADYSVAASSGTSALLVSLLALGVGRGDEVIVPAYTFVATYSSAAFCGAVPVLAEIDDSLTIDPNDIEHRITERTKAIVPVHMLGNPCAMEQIMDIARRHNLYVVEDCCQAAGATYLGRHVGTFGHFGAFSLNMYKTINAGDGGMIITNDEHLYRTAFAIHDQGHSPNRAEVEIGKRSILGLNFRIHELTGAVGLAQMRKFDYILSRLRKNKRKLKDMLRDIPGIMFRTIHDEDGECATLLTIILQDKKRAQAAAAQLGTKTVDQSGWHVYSNMEHVMQYLREHNQPAGKGSYPQTDDLLERSINISVGVDDSGLGSAFGINILSSEKEIESVGHAVRKALEQTTA